MFLAAAAAIHLPAPVQAQDPGRIVGRVLSTQTGEGLPSAQVHLPGLQIGALSSLDGRFVLTGVPEGTYDLRVDLLGYASKTVTGLVVAAGQTQSLDVALEPQAVALEELVVSATVERGNTTALLGERQRAATVVDAIGSDQISRSPDGDAASALKRVPGLSVVDGKYAYVRGLGERYSGTTLNGAPLASPVPDRKVIPLDVIPSSMLESIVTSKSFSPDQPGDYAGGLVQLRTKDFPTFRIFNVSVSAGYNTAASFADVLGYSGGSYDFLGFDDGTRSLPALVPLDRPVNGANFSDEQLQEIGRSFGGPWGPLPHQAPLNQSFGLSLGDEIELFDRSFGFLASLTQSSQYSVRGNLVERVLASSGGADPEVNYAGEHATHSASMGGLLNLSYQIAPLHSLRFNGLFNRLTDDGARQLEGFNLDSNTNQRNTRIQYVAQTLLNAQLAGDHGFDGLGGLELSWRSAYTRAERDEPNTREVLYREFDGRFVWDDFVQSGSVFHQDMTDDGLNGAISLRLPFTFRSLPAALSAGASVDRKDRTTFTRRFRFRPQPGGDINGSVRTLAPNELFQPQYISPSGFEIQESTFNTDNYDASEQIDAAFLMADAELLPRLRFQGGVRVERSRQTVDPHSLFANVSGLPGADVDRTTVLPALNLTYQLSDRMNLRASASRTVARPQLRELAPFSFADYAGGYLVVGNPVLDVSRIRNLDLRWEWFFQTGGLFAISGFHKEFTDPIEVVVLPSSELIKSWTNAASADDYGVEIELRTSLGYLAEPLRDLSFNANVTLVQSEVQTGGEAEVYIPGTGATTIEVVDRSRALQGQSQWVTNLGLSYFNEGNGTTLTALFNRFGDRIDAVGRDPNPDIVEEGRNTFDFVIEQRLWEQVSAKLSASRLLGNEVEFTQGGDIVRSYDLGHTISVSLRWGT